MGCTAVPFRYHQGPATKAKVCETIAWQIGICETTMSPINDGMHHCDSVVIEDLRRLEVESDCLTREPPSTDYEALYKAVRDCQKGTPDPTCDLVVECYRDLGFEWSPPRKAWRGWDE